MERTSKATFIAVSNRNIEKYNSFVNVFDILIKIAKEWDDKKINKRFIDKVNELLRDNHISYVRFCFDTNWRNDRTNRFKLYFDDRWVEEARAYISCNEEIIFAHNGDYLDKDDYRLNAENFIIALEREKEICKNQAQDLQACIEQVDEVIEEYTQMKVYVERTLAEIPSPLRERIDVRCPVY